MDEQIARLEDKIDKLTEQISTLRETIAAMKGYGLGVAAAVSAVISLLTGVFK